MMEYFSGLDVSLRSCALCIVDGKGKVMLEREMPCEVDDIAACLAGVAYSRTSGHLFRSHRATCDALP
jgi:transposase